MFTSTSKRYDDGLQASYNISEQLILPAISEVLITVLYKSAKEILLSNNTIQRRIDKMSDEL